MKSKRVTTILIALMLSITGLMMPLCGQVVEIHENNWGNVPNPWVSGTTYRLILDQGQNNDALVVPLGANLVIQAGAIVEFAADKSLVIQGTLQAGAVGQVTHFRRIQDGDAWDAIFLECVDDEASGEATMVNCWIRGGGSANNYNPRWGAGQAEAEQMASMIIVEAQMDDENERNPRLNLQRCQLLDSEGHGVGIGDFSNVNGNDNAVANVVVDLEACVIGDQNDIIAWTGVWCWFRQPGLLSVVDYDIDITTLPWGTSEIKYCGRDGFYATLSGVDFMNLLVDGTSIHHNGRDGIRRNAGLSTQMISNSVLDLNGQAELGHGYGHQNVGSSAIWVINNSSASSNTNCGLWFHHPTQGGEIKVYDSHFNSNGSEAEFFEGRFDGVYIRFECESTAWIINNEANLNGSNGLHCHKGAATIPVVIKGNNTADNGQLAELVADPREGANIFVEGSIFGFDVQNNTCVGATCGIALSRDENLQVVNVPGGVDCRNNIQHDARMYGLLLDGLNDVQGVEIPSVIWNNYWHDNGLDGIFMVNMGAGIDVDKLKCNFLTNNLRFGINVSDGNAPGPIYEYNGFWMNGGNTNNCQIINSILSDPQYVESDLFDLGITDLHLRWNSPGINRGVQFGTLDPLGRLMNDADLDGKDGSRNDLGAFGGPGPEPPDLNEQEPTVVWDPYCAIAQIAGVNPALSNLGLSLADGFTFVEWDYYRAFCSFNVPQGWILDIGGFELWPNGQNGEVYFEMMEDVLFQVSGRLQVWGEQQLDFITFANYPGHRWNTIKFTQTADEASSLCCVDIFGAERGVVFTGISDLMQNTRIQVWNTNIHDCLYAGIDLIASDVFVYGFNPGRNQIFNISDGTQTMENIGLRLSNNVGGQDYIWNTEIFNCGRDQSFTRHCGVYFSSSNLDIIQDVSVHDNGFCGLSHTSSNPNYAGGPFSANDLFNNGVMANQGGILGAEIYLEVGSYPTINFLDVVDTRNPHGLSIYKCQWTNAGLLDAQWCWWGQQNPPANWFFWGIGNPINFANWQGAAIDDGQVDLLDLAVSLYQQGRYQEALAGFYNLVDENKTQREIINSLRTIPACLRNLNGDFEPYRVFLQETANRFDEDVRLAARLLVPFSYVAERNFEEALSAYWELAANGESDLEKIVAELNALDMMEIVNDDFVTNLDGHFNINAERARLNQRLNLNGEHQARVEVPEMSSLTGVYPNPFNSTASIRYQLESAQKIELTVIDINGRTIAKLYEGFQDVGSHDVTWTAGTRSAGVYFISLQLSDGSRDVRKVNLVK